MTTPALTGSRPLSILVSIVLGLAIGSCGGDEPTALPAGGQGAEGPSDPPVFPFMVGPKDGRWVDGSDRRVSSAAQSEIDQLHSIGYAEGVHDATELSGVVRHDAARAFGGVNLYTPAHEATSRLIDMQGRVLHEWSYDFWDVWPDYPKRNKFSTFWRRTHLFENGDLLAIYEGLGLIKLDKDSNLLWSSPVRAHHDLVVTPDGTIYVLARAAHIDKSISETRPILEDFIAVLDENGKVVQRILLLDAIRDTPFDRDWSKRIELTGDLFHTNSLRLLDGSLADRNPAFRKGNFLVSMLMMDLVAVVDPTQQKIVWGHAGPYVSQHDPQVLDTGAVMVFDNLGGAVGEQPGSRFLELDPESWEVTWSYAGSEQEPFYSETCGMAERLPNGNTLITESDYGRAFEITREGDTVWEFYNPHRAGAREQYIATLMEMRRLQPEFPLDWVDGQK
jgi:hypothetical protein